MRLGFIYTPVRDLKASLEYYRALGFTELWREGELTAALKIEGNEAGILLDQDDRESGVGPFYVVDDVVKFYDEHASNLAFTGEPHDIPPGKYAAFTDPDGNMIRIMDNSKHP